VGVQVDASLGALDAIGGAIECLGTSSGGPTCIQNGVEQKVRAAFDSLAPGGFTVQGVDQCKSNPTQVWHVSNTGDIFLSE
jgi:hypothetical protein